MIDAKESASHARRWLGELQLAKKEDKKWVARGKKIVKRYRDDRENSTGMGDGTKRYNILWSNVQTMLPALYGKKPRAQVERRWKDQDPVGRTAATILERVLQYEIDHYGDFDEAVKQAVVDRLLPGRGTSWNRLENIEITLADGKPGTTMQRTPCDYVFWEDFRCSPARTWEEVTWVARRVYMTKAAGVERFGKEFAQVPLVHEPIGLDELRNQGAAQSEIEQLKKARVWEIWDKASKCLYFVADGYDLLLDKEDDPLGLDGFWPCAKPLYATQTTDTIVPVPDYALYQDQAQELDKLTNRISMLVDAVKVVGVYDSSQPSIQRMLSEGVNNTLIPVDNWAAFGEKGGIKGTVDFLPLEMVVKALNECYIARESCKQVIYDVTGLSDIIRGSTVASETATAQRIKSQYASLRLKRMQLEVAQFTSDMLRIKGQLIADCYSNESLVEMSGIMGTLDAEYVEDALKLLKTEPIRSFRIEVASDSLIEMDEQAEKESRTEFLESVGTFMERSLPVVQQAPELGPLVGEMLLFGVRAFKGGRPIEAAFDEAMAKLQNPQPKPAPPDPEQIKAQGAMQLKQMEVQATGQLDAAKLQAQGQLEQFKAQQALQLEQARMTHELQMEHLRQAGETERARLKAQLDAQTKLQIAEMSRDATLGAANISSQTTKETAAMSADTTMKAAAESKKPDESLMKAVEKLADQVDQIRLHSTAPRKIVKGKDGRVAGVEINGVVIPVTR